MYDNNYSDPTSPTQPRFTWLMDALGAIAFYTTIPVPPHWPARFHHVARLAPVVGLGIGAVLSLINRVGMRLEVPALTLSALLVVLWVGLTGGLHLDGAMDTADGLAAPPARRLEVMVDSATGAFGAMAGISILLLKTAALAELDDFRGWGFVLAAGWGRWGQQVAIARYPYLKPTGKGAFHKDSIRSLRYTVPCGLLMVIITGLLRQSVSWNGTIAAIGGGLAIATLSAAWFHRQLGGHTGDTYGAVVEWTEALFLVFFTSLLSATST